MAERAWMPIYWGDYVRDTLHLNTFQHGCYLLLIAAYWIRGGPLPNDPKYLAQVCRTTQDKLARYGNPVLAMFTCEDGLLVHKRIEKELLKVSARSATARANAKSSRATTTTRILDSSLRSESETPAGVDQPDLDALFYQRGKALLGKKAGGQLTKLRAAVGSVGVALEIIDQAQHKDSPAEYVAGCIRNRGNGVTRYARQPAGNQRASVVETVRRLAERRQQDFGGTGDDAFAGEGRELERR